MKKERGGKWAALITVAVMLLAPIVPACSPAREPVSLTVGAGAGLSEVLPVLKEAFERAYPSVRVNLTFGSAGTLAAQVRQGAPLDALVVPSGGGHLDALVQEGCLLPDSRVVVAADELVLAVSVSSPVSEDPWSWLAGPKVRRIALGDPQTVPAGTYALQTLRHLGLAERVGPRLLYARTVRQALAYVEQGEAEAALVYRSTLRGSNRVRLAAVAPPEAHEPIVFEGAVLKATRHTEEARRFLEYLRTPEAVRVLEEYGFKRPE
ncbi:MAG: molybdate ABC transporter substrate-binding protein [Moorellales bacterium]